MSLEQQEIIFEGEKNLKKNTQLIIIRIFLGRPRFTNASLEGSNVSELDKKRLII
jgi:hypothetical protein